MQVSNRNTAEVMREQQQAHIERREQIAKMQTTELPEQAERPDPAPPEKLVQRVTPSIDPEKNANHVLELIQQNTLKQRGKDSGEMPPPREIVKPDQPETAEQVLGQVSAAAEKGQWIDAKV